MKQVIDFFTAHHLSLTNKKIVVSTSGGPDSMALLAMLINQKEQFHLQLLAAHFDHQLRSDSAHEAEVIKQYCAQHNVVFVSQKWQHGQIKHGIEASARTARYAFLVQTMRKYHGDYLLTAHHNDDLLENILLKFVRSGNPSEMNSLQAAGQMQGVTLLRPLLNWTKEELLSYDRQNGIPFVIDQTNAADNTQRNRLRHHVLPQLKAENPHLGANALNFSKNITLLFSIANKEFAKIGPPQLFLDVAYRLPQTALADFTQEQQQFYWQNFIWRKWHLRVNDSLAGFTLLNYQGYFYLMRNNLPLPEKSSAIKLDRPFFFAGRQFVVTKGKKAKLTLIGTFYLTEQATLTAGSLTQGAKLLLKNGHHSKSKKKFAESAIPAPLRPFCLTLFAAGQPVFVEQTYQQQTFAAENCCYYVYQLNNKK